MHSRMLTFPRFIFASACLAVAGAASAQPVDTWPLPAPPPAAPPSAPPPGAIVLPPGAQVVDVSQGPGPRVIYVQTGAASAQEEAIVRPYRLPYQDGDVVPRGYAPRSEPDRGMLIAGLTTFGTGYVLSALVGGVLGSDGDNSGALALLVPIAGPFITIDTLHTTDAGTYGLVFDGITQIVGAGFFVASFIAPRHYLLKVGDARMSIGVAPGGGSVRLRF